jgi:hypothetical protein
VSTISDLEVLVQDRLEETRDGVGVFWNLKNELRPLLVEAMSEAILITGLPQVRAGTPFTLAANTRLFSLVSPAFVVTRMDGATTIEKTSFWALDQDRHNWEADSGPLPLRWFPFGVGQFGIYPTLTAPVQVFLTTLNFPVSVSSPYTGTETVPFSVGFQESLASYAASMARLKESGSDFVNGLVQYERFLSKMGELSKFGDRIGKLRFTRSAGVPAQASDTQVR